MYPEIGYIISQQSDKYLPPYAQYEEQKKSYADGARKWAEISVFFAVWLNENYYRSITGTWKEISVDKGIIEDGKTYSTEFLLARFSEKYLNPNISQMSK